ncbi:MAG: phosphatidate cytidylyltransferase [Azoarcus sp.]|jgi:phosphatidate cytidylyltransferase|nr:phosphatidate cytidylyltransferase [Azoarcus sp.]
MLRTRIVTAVFLLAGLLGALFFLPGPGWIALCVLICAVAAWEWGGLAGWNGKARIAYAVALGTLCAVLDHSIGAIEADLFLLAALFWLFVVPFWLKYKWSLNKWSAALVGCIVLVPPTLVFIVLRESIGPVTVLVAAAPVWIADIAAYFSGRAFGRAKLAPSISPGKTWAGAIGATLGVMAYCSAVFAAVANGFHIEKAGILLLDFTVTLGTILVILTLSVVLTALSIVGDLFESLLKRQAGVKDSSNLLPGHGGVLDRIDSLTSTLPVLAVLEFIFFVYLF